MDTSLKIDRTGSKVTIIMDMSQFDLFNLCELRYYNAHFLRLRQPKVEAGALDKGGFIHEGYEVYYKLLAEGKHFDDRMEQTLLSFRSLAADVNKTVLTYEESAELIKIAEENLTFWRGEDESLEILAVEEVFAFVLYEDEDVRIIITGKIDILANKPGLGRGADYLGLPYDHKTYSRDGFLSDLSNQFMCYCFAVESNYLMVNRIGLQKTIAPHDKYKRIPMSYDNDQLQQWRRNTIEIIMNRYLMCVSTNKWTMNFTSCDKFNRRCEYFDMCRASGQDAKDFLAANHYVIGEPWDVTKKLERRGD